MRHPLLLLLTALIPLAASTGCETDRPLGRLRATAEAQAEPRGPLYSPWVLDVDGADPSFEEISFKDVGLSGVSEDRERVYEAIAMSLAREIQSDGALELTSRVRYSEAMSDPSNHLSCAPRHVYVDLWQSTRPERWGYSLWSGCGEDDQFAWREVERTGGDDEDEDAAIASLTRSIAGSLREAVRTGCFTRHC